MQCPKCHRYQDETFECIYCGVVMPKFAQLREEEQIQAREEARQRFARKRLSDHWLAPYVYAVLAVVCVVTVAVLLWPEEVRRESPGEIRARQMQLLTFRIDNVTLKKLDDLENIMRQRLKLRKTVKPRTRDFLFWAERTREVLSLRRQFINEGDFDYAREERYLSMVENTVDYLRENMITSPRGTPVDLPPVTREELYGMAPPETYIPDE
ncbi:MAG: hypothetical protein ACLFOY_01440 [Desulfatibacillaceae bacterium]